MGDPGSDLVREEQVEVTALDGVVLRGTLARSSVADAPVRGVLLVHGGGVTREEGGFFTRLAAGLATAGVASLRLDLRGHGTSDGRQEELTLAAILNDIRVGVEHLATATGATTSLLGASFTGGLCACYAARRPGDVERLVLLNPQFDYLLRTVHTSSLWQGERLTPAAVRFLDEHGYVQFRPTLRHGRPILNEVFWFDPAADLEQVTAPTLLVHGTGDTLVPIDTTRAAAKRLRAPHQLVEIEGAQHGFAAHDDPGYHDPRTKVLAGAGDPDRDGLDHAWGRGGLRVGARLGSGRAGLAGWPWGSAAGGPVGDQSGDGLDGLFDVFTASDIAL